MIPKPQNSIFSLFSLVESAEEEKKTREKYHIENKTPLLYYFESLVVRIKSGKCRIV